MKKAVCCLAVIAAFSTIDVQAHQQGDYIVRAGLASVIPNDSSDKILGSDYELKVNTNTQFGLTLGYMLTDNWSVELLAASPFSHDISTDLSGLGDVATTKQLPPTLMVEYYFGDSQSQWRPYAGIGVNYTTFYDSDFNSTGKAAGLSDLELDDSWGLAANLGVDYMINDTWFANASLWYADIDTTAHYKAGSTSYSTDVHIDPLVVMVSAGYTF